MRIRVRASVAGALAVACVLLAWTVPASAAAEVLSWKGEGPATMSDEEKAIAADPAKGLEHAVILLVELEDKEDDPAALKISFHLRAKILSPKGRDLGNVEIPYDAERWKIKQWWGRSIQPDGTVLSLPVEKVEEVTLKKMRGRELRTRKAALPGVVPGSVIDYGYVLEQENAKYVDSWWRIRLQWAWPVRELRYIWIPYGRLVNGFVLTRASGLDAKAERYINTVRVLGRNLPPVDEEPYMPPLDNVRAAAWFFYFNKDDDYKDFWNSKAKIVDERAAAFMHGDKQTRSILAQMNLPESANLEEKLKLAYAWILEKVKIDRTDTSESLSTLTGDTDLKRRTFAEEVVENGKGSRIQLLMLMMGVARALGADADLVLATDRTDHLWIHSVYTMSQFDDALLAIRAPGEPVEKATLLAPQMDLPWGVVPYWFTSGPALVVTPGGAEDLKAPSSPAEENTSHASAQVVVGPDGDPAHVSWSRTVSGQRAVDQEFSLRTDTEEKRQERLDGMCGKSSSFELESAKVDPAPAGEFGGKLECEGSLPEVTAGDGVDELRVPVLGPWVESYPEFPRDERTQPILFDYPFLDEAAVELEVPPGFRPREIPEPVVVDSPFGAYSLKIEASGESIRIERSLRLPHLSLPANRIKGLQYFLNKVREADRTKIAFERGEAS
ncbi:MAG TPA: DUF3857 domain-containing protein [Candidatus Saccharimonadales bacterium]|nr:DUF3857 domain-containing protein [Candidatus Saccharimonadales bacterium]